jgi:hypothetical protein
MCNRRHGADPASAVDPIARTATTVAATTIFLILGPHLWSLSTGSDAAGVRKFATRYKIANRIERPRVPDENSALSRAFT